MCGYCVTMLSSCVDGEDDNEYFNYLLSVKYSRTSIIRTV